MTDRTGGSRSEAGRIRVHIESRPAGEIAFLTIDRPAKLNALSPGLIGQMEASVRRLHGRKALRALVVTGAGERAFVGGADIVAMSGFERDGAVAFITALHRAIDAVRRLPVPVIARIDGFCLGAGLELAAACDLRLASEQARFGMPEVKVGMPSVIEAALLPRLVGAGRAARLVLLGEVLAAPEALAIGLVDRVCPASTLDRALEDWLGHILAAGPEALRLQKKLLADWQELPLSDAIEAGIASFGQAYASGEPQRMTAAFLARTRRT
ncbi:MAG: enoyl-CoA hydratase/isomerase family protein [Alphaproteobacteria bacterium]|nr:enoyl-CoA hydratase/isomerase family protein [Alphaproteobacteria bacterium]